jgi:hypothetical protein
MDHQDLAQLLGNYGEFIGAIAVVTTLVYLAVQVKQNRQSLDANTKAMRGQVVSEVMNSAIAYLQMFTQRDDVSELYVRFHSDESLEPAEMTVMDATISAMFIARQHEFFQWKQGLLDEKVFQALHHVTLTTLACENGRRWWKHEGSHLFSREFVDYVEEMWRESSSEDLQSWKRAVRLDD